MSDYTIDQIMSHPAFAEAFYTELYGPAGAEGLDKEAGVKKFLGGLLEGAGARLSALGKKWAPGSGKAPKAPKVDTPEARMMREAAAGKGSANAGLPKAPPKTDAAGKPKNLFGLKDEYVTPALIGTGVATGLAGGVAGSALSS